MLMLGWSDRRSSVLIPWQPQAHGSHSPLGHQDRPVQEKWSPRRHRPLSSGTHCIRLSVAAIAVNPHYATRVPAPNSNPTDERRPRAPAAALQARQSRRWTLPMLKGPRFVCEGRSKRRVGGVFPSGPAIARTARGGARCSHRVSGPSAPILASQRAGRAPASARPWMVGWGAGRRRSFARCRPCTCREGRLRVSRGWADRR